MADIDLCTVEEVMSFGNFTSKEPDNVIIESLITQVSKVFANYCGKEQFQSKVYTEQYDGEGNNLLFLNNVPVISVTSIHDDEDWVFDAAHLIDATTYTVVNNIYVALKSTVFSIGTQNIKVVYTAGYSTIPEDVNLSCIKEVVREFNRRLEGDVTARTLNDGSISYTEKGLMKSTKDILDNYIKRALY